MPVQLLHGKQELTAFRAGGAMDVTEDMGIGTLQRAVIGLNLCGLCVLASKSSGDIARKRRKERKGQRNARVALYSKPHDPRPPRDGPAPTAASPTPGGVMGTFL